MTRLYHAHNNGILRHVMCLVQGSWSAQAWAHGLLCTFALAQTEMAGTNQRACLDQGGCRLEVGSSEKNSLHERRTKSGWPVG